MDNTSCQIEQKELGIAFGSNADHGRGFKRYCRRRQTGNIVCVHAPVGPLNKNDSSLGLKILIDGSYMFALPTCDLRLRALPVPIENRTWMP